MKRWMLVVLSALLLVGCEIVPPAPTDRIEVIDIGIEREPERERTAPDRVARQVAFPEAEYAALPTRGSSVISGRLSLNGTPAAGETVSVAPVTTYSAEAAEQALAGRAVEPADPRARAYTHTTRTGGNGRFRLDGLPPGEFYVSGSVVDRASGERRIIIRQVSLGHGQRLEVDLSR
ncbi:carboxypeptidase-like regulatory domain-containing protein [Halomonas sp. C05BenzN]|uniref:carboxypeptidase-like regulatory domain-containing protein n=1 Tax=Halomonas sp. C05BenzN TaxID=3411041 RepID=UPI003B9246EC